MDKSFASLSARFFIQHQSDYAVLRDLRSIDQEILKARGTPFEKGYQSLINYNKRIKSQFLIRLS